LKKIKDDSKLFQSYVDKYKNFNNKRWYESILFGKIRIRYF
jgi:hypothetical protein